MTEKNNLYSLSGNSTKPIYIGGRPAGVWREERQRTRVSIVFLIVLLNVQISISIIESSIYSIL